MYDISLEDKIENGFTEDDPVSISHKNTINEQTDKKSQHVQCNKTKIILVATMFGFTGAVIYALKISFFP